MSSADVLPSRRRASFGLEGKLFALLVLLGAAVVLITGGLAYVRAHDALEEAIYHQLTIARTNKQRQVETYFRTIRNELVQLAATQMVANAARGFSSAYGELDRAAVPPELRQKVDDWYGSQFMAEMQRVLGRQANVADFQPVGSAAYHLQYHYIVSNPHTAERRRFLDSVGDDSAYSRLHAGLHPLLRGAAASFRFSDLLLVDPRSGRIVYTVAKETDLGAFLTSGLLRQSNLASAVARCSASVDRSTVCFEDFAPYAPSGGAPIAFMAVPVVDQGQVIGVLVAQLSIEEIDNVVTGDRRWRQDGFGDTGEAYLVGTDLLARSSPRGFYENPEAYYADLKQGGVSEESIDAVRRYGTPVLHQRIATEATRLALAGIEGTNAVVGYRGVPTLASWGPLAIPGTRWGLVAKIDAAEAFKPIYRLQRDLIIVGGVALLVVMVIGAWLSRALFGPLHELTAGVKRFGSGDYDTQVTVRTRDEIGTLCLVFNRMVDELRAKNLAIENKNRENEALLLNVLPAPIANRLRDGEQRIADGFAEVTVAFADIVDFTAMSSDMPPADIVALLNGLFSRFDDAARELGIEKIKTVGDAYMAVCGLPFPVADHNARMVRMAMRMVHITREHATEHRVSMRLRVGINSGPVVAGVIGKSKYIYDLWGDTVNLASRMEAGGVPDCIQVTRAVYESLKDEFAFEPRGMIEVKGKGLVEAWLLKF